ncbi:MAG: PQQ-dependent sugar dehydrogenase [Spirochaetota bacterium]
MGRFLSVSLAMVALAGCVSVGAVEPPQVSRGGDEAPSNSASYEALGLEVEAVASDLDTPWDLIWGPEGWIWFTERPGRLSRVHPETAEVEVIADIPSTERGESGLMGVELHPDFPEVPYVYLVQSYTADGSVMNRLLRYAYRDGSLTDRRVLLDSILGASYHDGARIVAGPDRRLYITTGDAGRKRLAQDTDSLNGKVLRVTLDGEPVADNPFGNEVFSYGHRNAQGLVFHPESGELYITEHGPRDNDEIALVRKGENHGWPAVHGFCDGDVGGEEAFCAEHEIAEPLAAWTPTIAPAGADFYDATEIPGWNGSFLFVTLKGSSLIRIVLSSDGREVVRQEVIGQGSYGRLRDVLVGPDGSVYIATSNRDGRGEPAEEDDRILRIMAK